MGSIIARLNEQSRPSGTMTFMFDQQKGLNGRLKINSDGWIIPEFMNKDWCYLDGITFIVS